MSDLRIQEMLAQAPAFSGLSTDILDRLARHASEIEVPRGQCVFKSGETASSFFLLIEGEVSIQIPAVTGPTLHVQRLTPVRALGWSWMLPPYKWSFNALVESDAKLLEFDGKAILAECEEDPAFGYQIVKRVSGLMAERLEAAHRKMMDQWSAPGFA